MVLAGTLSVSARSDVPPQFPQIINFADSLQVDAQTSAQSRLPIIIFVSQHGCKFCHLLRERVLHPMIEAGALQGRAILREISLDDGFRFDDFDGRNVSGSEFANRYQTAVTPTLLFLDGRGREVSKRMVGINNVEYYGFYLEKAIGTATTAIATDL
ncbi:MAG: thioredoxin family protein [Pseudomonadales bacterium]